MKYIFDVDGTLTPSRSKIDPEFAEWFLDFQKEFDVYLVTGSDRDKTIEQLGDVIYDNAKAVFNCSGNDVWSCGANVYRSEWKASKALEDMMYGWLQASPFLLRTGNHIEERPGCVNFSIIGRNCSKDERLKYIEHDLNNRERETIAFQINSEFPELMATVGGETGIDIYPTGKDKSQILSSFPDHDTLHFFGDKMEPGGNDYPLGSKLKYPSRATQVRDWKHTWELLEIDWLKSYE